MRTGISVTLKPIDRRRLKALARDRNTPHKHAWGAEIVLFSADGIGTNEIMRRTGKSKTCVWRWQERFMLEGYDGLLRDKTRPSRILLLGSNVTERVVMLTQTAPPAEATHWTSAMMAKVVDISASSIQRVWRAHGLQPHRVNSSSSPPTRNLSASCAISSAFMSIRPPMPSSSRSMRRARSRRSTALSPACR
jgi:transposase